MTGNSGDYYTHLHAHSFEDISLELRNMMRVSGRQVKTETWQGQDVSQRPDMVTTELLNVTVSLETMGREGLDRWRQEIKPNVPWADDHFLERVGGVPLNPPPSWAWWPWAGSAAKHRDAAAKFNHTYPERYWPKTAGKEIPSAYNTDGSHKHGGQMFAESVQFQTPHSGIRGEYGDLGDVVDLLESQPHTRQAYLPIFFPEDTGVGDGGRKPCTLGYQFIVRAGRLHCFYPMRSCDLIRHFADDVYLTVRLMIWMLEQLRGRNESFWSRIEPGTLTMHMTSLHIFENDRLTLQREFEERLARSL